MRNAAAVRVKKGVTAIGAGLLEAALEREGRKGCSPILCVGPVALEPGYQRFDSSYVLGPGDREVEEAAQAGHRSVELVTYDVYPAEEDLLSIGWMETMLRCLGVLRGPLAFEVFGTNGRVWVRFAIPESEVAGFKAGVLGHFPALGLRRVDEPFPSAGLSGVNELVPVAPYHRTLTLLGQEGASPLSLATKVLSELAEGEHGVFQVLLCPAKPGHDWHYNVENLLEAEKKAVELAALGGLSSRFKYDEELPPRLEPGAVEKVGVDVSFYAVVARYAAWGTGEEETREFLQGMRVAAGMLRFGNRAWRVLDHDHLVGALGEEAVEAMVTERQAHRPGLMLTSREAASLVHIPNARALSMLACIEQRTGFEWTPLQAFGDGVARLGANHYAGESTPVEIPQPLRLRHMYIAGTTGSGKSKLLERLAVDDAHQGMGFCLVDPHGDLCFDVLSRLARERLEDLVYVSFSEEGLVPRWNPFRAGVAPGKLADDMARAFLAQTPSWGARMEHNIRMLAYITCEVQGTLNDFAELAARSDRGEELREKALDEVANSQVQRFLRAELPKYSSGELGSVTNKLSRLLLDDQLGTMFTQPENGLMPRSWMDQGKVVLVNLASGSIGSDHARFVGSVLVSLIYRAATSRSQVEEGERRAFILYLDEFQALQAATLAEILSEGRKYGLGSVLAHQERGQVGKELVHAVGNAAVKVYFRPGEDDMPHVVRSLGGRVSAEDLRGLGVGPAYVSSKSQMASLETELTDRPHLREPRRTARRFAEEHYHPVRRVEGVVRRRPRVYDTFQTEEG